MSGIALEVALILLLLVINGIFSMSEMAVVSARKTRLQHRAENGDAGARAALDLAANPTNFLSTVQFGITLVGVLAGAFGGAGIAEALAAYLRDVRWIGPHAQPVALGLVVAAITYLSLVIGELVPKQIALGNPERVAALVSRPMRAVASLGRPLVALLTGSTNLVFRLVGRRTNVDRSVTEQDVRALLEQGAEGGRGGSRRAHDHGEHLSARRPPREHHHDAASSMSAGWTSRPGPTGCEPLSTEARWSPYVVCDGDIEHVVGLAEAEDLLAQCLAGKALDLRAVLREPLYVPTSMPVMRLLETFRTSRRSAALVLDEFGGVAGVATVDDIIEGLVGELPDADDSTPPAIARQPDGTWLIDGGAPVADVDEVLDLDLPRGAETREFDTVGGLVMMVLGRLPKTGDSVDYAGARFVVERMDGRRVATVRARVAGG